MSNNLRTRYDVTLGATVVIDRFDSVVDIVKTMDSNAAIQMAKAKMKRLNPFEDWDND